MKAIYNGSYAASGVGSLTGSRTLSSRASPPLNFRWADLVDDLGLSAVARLKGRDNPAMRAVGT
jgi:hypothetical protein